VAEAFGIARHELVAARVCRPNDGHRIAGNCERCDDAVGLADHRRVSEPDPECPLVALLQFLRYGLQKQGQEAVCGKIVFDAPQFSNLRTTPRDFDQIAMRSRSDCDRCRRFAVFVDKSGD
jgi:hypothetical protein